MEEKNQSKSSLRKRVLFVITQSEFGGAQHFLFDFITHLDHTKFDPFLAVGHTGDGELINSLNGQLPIYPLSKLTRDISPWQDFSAIWELRRLIKKIGPDVLFLNSSKAGLIGSLAAHWPLTLPRLRVIYRIGGWTFNDPRPRWEKRLLVFLEKFSAKWKNIIIVNNKHDLEQAQQLGIRPKDNLVLVHNGLEAYKLKFIPREEARLKLFEKIAKRAGKIFPAPEGRGSPNEIGRQIKILIGTIANFYPTKGLRYLVEAAETFRDDDEVVFVVLGEGEERPLLEKLIADKRLEKRFFLMGRIPQAREFLSAFDIFVLPSVKEGFPWAVLEAMTAKISVVATRVGAIPEIIEDGKNGFIVDPARPPQIAAKIRALLDDDRLRQEFGIQGHQTVLFKFGLDKMVNQIESLL